jgi:hypothetical protein
MQNLSANSSLIGGEKSFIIYAKREKGLMQFGRKNITEEKCIEMHCPVVKIRVVA